MPKSPETPMESQNTPLTEKEHSIVPTITEKYEQKITEMQQLNLEELGFKDEEIEAAAEFYKQFELMIKEAQDEPDLFLARLSENGIGIFRNSYFLKSRESPMQALHRLSGSYQGNYVGASFLTPAIIQRQIESLRDINSSNLIFEELRQAAQFKGAIFLSKQPSAKSIFHEGAHAIQMIQGMDMDASDDEIRLKREIEVNLTLIQNKQNGLLKDVTRGKFKEGTGPFGPTATLETTDIFQEVDYLLSNIDKLNLVISGRKNMVAEENISTSESLTFEEGEKLSPLVDERPEEYLSRITQLIYKKKYGGNRTFIFDKGMNIHSDSEYSDYVTKALKLIDIGQKKEKFSDEKNQKTLAEIEKSLTQATNKAKIDESDQATFSHTNQQRSFFGKATKTDNIPYSHSLFGIGLNSLEAVNYLQGKVKDKTIYLLGGGDSLRDLITSPDLAPKQVVNIDPYVGTESIEKGKNGNYMSFGVEAQNPNAVKETLDAHNIEPADEIWASYSVPYYLSTPEDINGLFQTIKQSLAENGTARITPLALQGGDGFEKAKEELMNQVQSLMSSQDYNVYLTTGSAGGTLFIERLPFKNS